MRGSFRRLLHVAAKVEAEDNEFTLAFVECWDGHLSRGGQLSGRETIQALQTAFHFSRLEPSRALVWHQAEIAWGTSASVGYTARKATTLMRDSRTNATTEAMISSPNTVPKAAR